MSRERVRLEEKFNEEIDAIQRGGGFSTAARQAEADRLWEKMQTFDDFRPKIRRALDSPRHVRFIGWPPPEMRESIADLVAARLVGEE